MKKKVNGLEVDNITHKNPGNSLPKFVKDAAVERGYGDARQSLSLFVTEADVSEAFACAAQGNGAACVMAQAGTRIGAKAVYFYRTTAWVDFGSGPIVRFQTSKSIYNNVIAPFDEGKRDSVLPGIYHLTPPVGVARLDAARRNAAKRYEDKYKATGTTRIRANEDGTKAPRIQAHMERVVMGSRIK